MNPFLNIEEFLEPEIDIKKYLADGGLYKATARKTVSMLLNDFDSEYKPVMEIGRKAYPDLLMMIESGDVSQEYFSIGQWVAICLYTISESEVLDKKLDSRRFAFNVAMSGLKHERISQKQIAVFVRAICWKLNLQEPTIGI